ncbi:MAG: hypothetical protein NT163_12305, partial [Chlorobiales bacterium]|nr:hypothetical protein [Chlorobiales bacterium]
PLASPAIHRKASSALTHVFWDLYFSNTCLIKSGFEATRLIKEPSQHLPQSRTGKKLGKQDATTSSPNPSRKASSSK